MYYYGLHFVGSDKVPVQVRVHTKKTEIWARSAPNGEWTPWRRLDVTRNADGTLAEQVNEATHAKDADTAGRLRKPALLTFTGGVSGKVGIDGSEDVQVSLSVPQLASLESRIAALESRIAALEGRGSYGGD